MVDLKGTLQNLFKLTLIMLSRWSGGFEPFLQLANNTKPDNVKECKWIIKVF